MPVEMNYLPVNWIDGMKISRKHFEETGWYTEALAKDISTLNLTDFNFGIQPSDNPLDLLISCDFSHQISIELKACKAITPDGSRIRIRAAESLSLRTNFKDVAVRYNLRSDQPQQLLVLLSINPFQRLPTGEPLLNENPPRHPYTSPAYSLDLLPAEVLNPSQLSASIVIGKIIWQNGELQVPPDYIPACTSMKSLPRLTDWFDRFREALENWEQYCIKIIQKINAKAQAQPSNALANNILKISEKMFEQLVKQKIHFQWIESKSPPAACCLSLLENLQYVHALQQCYPEKDREEMINYFAEWTDTAPGALEKQTLKVLQLTYQHADAGAALNEIYLSYQSYLRIFLKLSQLDFIGKKKGQHIFVIEQEVKPVNSQPAPKTNNRWSPLT